MHFLAQIGRPCPSSEVGLDPVLGSGPQGKKMGEKRRKKKLVSTERRSALKSFEGVEGVEKLFNKSWVMRAWDESFSRVLIAQHACEGA